MRPTGNRALQISKNEWLLLALFVLIALAAATVAYVAGAGLERGQEAALVPSATPGLPATAPPAGNTPVPTSVPQVQASPSPTATLQVTPTATACVPPAGWVLYTVQPDETLFSIAARYGLAAADLQAANCLLSGDVILAGEELYVPYPITPTSTPCAPPAGWVPYVVQADETMFRIALRYGMTAEALQAANCLSAPAIQAGQTLYVPYLIPAPPVVTPEGSGEEEATEEEQPSLPSLKGEIFFDPGGEIPPARCASPIDGAGRHITASERVQDLYQLCIYGFTMGETVTVTLDAPGDGFVGSRQFVVSNEEDSTTVIRINLWMPVGLPLGEWQVNARSAGAEAEGTLPVAGFAARAMSVLPVGAIDPFENRNCDAYAAGQSVVVRGTGFPAGTWIPLAIYRETGQFGPVGELVQAYVRGQMVKSDALGDLEEAFFAVADTDPAGRYWVLPVFDLEADRYGSAAADVECYRVQ